MGMFSWICSDTGRALTCWDCYSSDPEMTTKEAFVLVPEEFGGKPLYTKWYDGYGMFYNSEGGESDIYAVFARWNKPEKCCGDDNVDRQVGIDLQYKTPSEIKYPIKIVEKLVPYSMAKESRDDPHQGCGYVLEED